VLRERKPPPRRLTSAEWSGIRIWMSAGSLPKCYGFIILCRRQSFRWVLRKSAGDCMRKANKSPKIPDSATVREVEKWSGIRIRDPMITTKSKSVLPIGRPNHNTKFQWNRLITFVVILLTDTERQTDRMTNKPHRITLLGVITAILQVSFYILCSEKNIHYCFLV